MFEIYCPTDAEDPAVTLKNPQAGDILRLEGNAVLAKLRSGLVLTRTISTRPLYKTRVFDFHFVPKFESGDMDLEELKTVLRSLAGLEIRCVMADETEFNGFITNEIEFINMRDNIRYAFHLEILETPELPT